MESIIKIDHLSYSYDRQNNILNDISLNVPQGSIYGFLGPNGSGKSTTMRLLTGIITAPSNKIELFGKPLETQLPTCFQQIGSIIDSPTIYYHLTGYQNLKYLATIHKVEEQRIHEVLELVDLAKAQTKKASKYSLGMKQRLAIAMALLHRPKLLLLDEPVNGLDPNGMVEVRNMLVKINKEEGVTIFISSHLLAEIEKMCTHIGMIHKGKIYYEGKMDELNKENQGKMMVQVLTANAEALRSYFTQKETEYQENNTTGHFMLSLENLDELPKLVKELALADIPILEVKRVENLEDWFMNIVANN